ncbi:hypothetical protein RHSIM_Rhsim11G0112500 [Rhododendron simsii]|uniref:Uncharacterized protein n=1 Tax=Rhododendron simsii TaxID=118357 RepID=A0A834GAS2_RHOSS|nr:hypothetical protein RHSIM_Rhsim11G0112500 [Rhododendron simsii]
MELNFQKLHKDSNSSDSNLEVNIVAIDDIIQEVNMGASQKSMPMDPLSVYGQATLQSKSGLGGAEMQRSQLSISYSTAMQLGELVQEQLICGICNNVLYFTALEYLKAGKDCFKFADKSLLDTIMAELTTMKYDGSRRVQEHILNMYDKAAMLATLGIQVDESFLIQAILNSLPV